MDISKVTNPEAKIFLEQFLANRNINLEFYKRVPEFNLDFRMVDTAKRKSDSPRESLVHQIAVNRQYLEAVNSGKLEFGAEYKQSLRSNDLEDLNDAFKLSKQELIQKLEQETQNVIDLLSNAENFQKKVEVSWSKEPINAVTMLDGLDSHEVLHTGWNLAIMDHLNIERFPELKEIWG